MSRRQSSSRIYRLGIISDLHVFSRYGLVPPSFRPVAPLPSATIHDYLWDVWADFVKRCPQLDVLLINGDIIEGESPSRRDAMDALSDDLNLQADAAVETLKPLCQKARHLWITRGTPYHEGRHFEIIERIALDLGAEEWAPRRYTGYVLEGTFHGLRINATHHVTLGAIYRGTIADRMALFAAAAESLGKAHEADIIIRSHSHMKFIGKSHGKWVVLTPAWKVVSPYAAKRMEWYRASLLSDIGGLVLETDGAGSVAWREFDYPPATFAIRKLA